MKIIDWINKIKYQMLAKIQLRYQHWGGPDLYTNAYTWGRVPSRAFMFYKLSFLIKARILSICFQYFTIWHLCTSRTHLNVAIISLFFANIWYLIKLIHSIIIILRVFMFYKQRVLANVWGRKDSAICASRKRSGHYYTIWHLCTSRTHLNVAIISIFLPTFDTWLN